MHEPYNITAVCYCIFCTLNTMLVKGGPCLTCYVCILLMTSQSITKRITIVMEAHTNIMISTSSDIDFNHGDIKGWLYKEFLSGLD